MTRIAAIILLGVALFLSSSAQAGYSEKHGRGHGHSQGGHGKHHSRQHGRSYGRHCNQQHGRRSYGHARYPYETGYGISYGFGSGYGYGFGLGNGYGHQGSITIRRSYPGRGYPRHHDD